MTVVLLPVQFGHTGVRIFDHVEIVVGIVNTQLALTTPVAITFQDELTTEIICPGVPVHTTFTEVHVVVLHEVGHVNVGIVQKLTEPVPDVSQIPSAGAISVQVAHVSSEQVELHPSPGVVFASSQNSPVFIDAFPQVTIAHVIITVVVFDKIFPGRYLVSSIGVISAMFCTHVADVLFSSTCTEILELPTGNLNPIILRIDSHEYHETSPDKTFIKLPHLYIVDSKRLSENTTSTVLDSLFTKLYVYITVQPDVTVVHDAIFTREISAYLRIDHV
jgi:hypothetical protein